MKWEKMSPHAIKCDEGYIIARYNVDKVVRYRPSLGGSFISGPASAADEAKEICERHRKDAGK